MVSYLHLFNRNSVRSVATLYSMTKKDLSGLSLFIILPNLSCSFSSVLTDFLCESFMVGWHSQLGISQI